MVRVWGLDHIVHFALSEIERQLEERKSNQVVRRLQQHLEEIRFRRSRRL